MALQDFDPQVFLDRDWQQRPRLLRAALPGYDCPVDGDDLAGLACEDDVESRIIIEHEQGWELRHGPFAADDFAALPTTGWTLLVQGVDQLIPEVADLFRHFRFLPRWRTDDIMISYAVDGGNVGPHFDQYDVFLLQGRGQRRWQIGQRCDDGSPLLPQADLRLLQQFQLQQEYLLEAGDILYLPPGVAHWGPAVGDDCITLSVGFRAPSTAELLGHWADEVATQLPASERYRDPPLSATDNCGEISSTVIDELRRRLQTGLDDEGLLAQWFGKLMTQAKAGPDGMDYAPAVSNPLAAALRLRLGVRLAYDRRHLFADGEVYCYSDNQQAAVQRLCTLEGDELLPSALRQSLDNELVSQLVERGILLADDYHQDSTD